MKLLSTHKKMNFTFDYPMQGCFAGRYLLPSYAKSFLYFNISDSTCVILPHQDSSWAAMGAEESPSHWPSSMAYVRPPSLGTVPCSIGPITCERGTTWPSRASQQGAGVVSKHLTCGYHLILSLCIYFFTICITTSIFLGPSCGERTKTKVLHCLE